MNTTQPDALALADYLDLPHISQHKSAAELRRLHTVEKESHEIIEAMKADAERFRWLLDTSSNWGICDWDSELCEWVRDGRMPEVVRKAIDAARSKP